MLGKLWRAWQGPGGDEVLLCAGLIALLASLSDAYSNGLHIAALAALLVLGRHTERYRQRNTDNA